MFLMPASRARSRVVLPDLPGNMTISTGVASNILTVTVTPTRSASLAFRDATLSLGDQVRVPVALPVSINTSAVGASFGVPNATPFRLWVLAFNNGGTVVLALFQSVVWSSSTPSAISPLTEAATKSTTAISGSATSAGVFYTPAGTSLTGKAFRILGYVDYGSGLVTSGTYATAPTAQQVFGPGIRRPGDVLQTLYFTTTTSTSTTSSTYQSTNVTNSISLASAAHLVRAKIAGPSATQDGSLTNVFVAIFRGASELASTYNAVNTAAISVAPVFLDVLDAPGTTASTAYTAKIKNQDNVTSVTYPRAVSTEGGGSIILDEVVT